MLVLTQSKANQSMTILLRAPLWASDRTVNVKIDNYSGVNLTDESVTHTLASWTTSAACGKGTSDPKVINLSSITYGTPPDTVTTISVGSYFITSAYGQYERVKVVAVESTRVILAAPAKLAYATGSVLTPAYLVYTIPSAAVVDEAKINVYVRYYGANGRLLSYNLDGYVASHPVGCPITVDDVYKCWPQLENMGQTINAGMDEMAEKVELVWDNVRSRLLSVGITPEMMKAVAVLKQVCLYEFGAMLAVGGVDPSGQNNVSQFNELIQSILIKKWNELFVTEQFVDKDETGVKSATPQMEGRRVEW